MQHVLTRAIRFDMYLSRIAATLSALFALSIFLYGTFLLMAVAHTAARTDIQQKMSAITSHVSQLETQYLAASKSLTLERAVALGFVVPKEVVSMYTAKDSIQLGYNAPSTPLVNQNE